MFSVNVDYMCRTIFNYLKTDLNELQYSKPDILQLKEIIRKNRGVVLDDSFIEAFLLDYKNICAIDLELSSTDGTVFKGMFIGGDIPTPPNNGFGLTCTTLTQFITGDYLCSRTYEFIRLNNFSVEKSLESSFSLKVNIKDETSLTIHDTIIDSYISGFDNICQVNLDSGVLCNTAPTVSIFNKEFDLSNNFPIKSIISIGEVECKTAKIYGYFFALETSREDGNVYNVVGVRSWFAVTLFILLSALIIWIFIGRKITKKIEEHVQVEFLSEDTR